MEPLNTAQGHQNRKWVRSTKGWFAGVCQGLGERWGVPPKVMRIFWVLSMIGFGTGLLVYMIATIALPREDELYEAEKKRILGVCVKLANMSGLEIGLVRMLAIFSAITSFGATIVAYFVLYFVLEDQPKH